MSGEKQKIDFGYALQHDNKALAAMFELVKIGALPLMTLVVSFYFPKAV